MWKGIASAVLFCLLPGTTLNPESWLHLPFMDVDQARPYILNAWATVTFVVPEKSRPCLTTFKKGFNPIPKDPNTEYQSFYYGNKVSFFLFFSQALPQFQLHYHSSIFLHQTLNLNLLKVEYIVSLSSRIVLGSCEHFWPKFFKFRQKYHPRHGLELNLVEGAEWDTEKGW